MSIDVTFETHQRYRNGRYSYCAALHTNRITSSSYAESLEDELSSEEGTEEEAAVSRVLGVPDGQH